MKLQQLALHTNDVRLQITSANWAGRSEDSKFSSALSPAAAAAAADAATAADAAPSFLSHPVSTAPAADQMHGANSNLLACDTQLSRYCHPIRVEEMLNITQKLRRRGHVTNSSTSSASLSPASSSSRISIFSPPTPQPNVPMSLQFNAIRHTVLTKLKSDAGKLA